MFWVLVFSCSAGLLDLFGFVIFVCTFRVLFCGALVSSFFDFVLLLFVLFLSE